MSAPVGWVYCLLNPSFPGYIKVGCSTNHPIERARQLSAGSGVPTPYAVGYHRYVAYPFQVEAALHRALAAYRVNDSREFFALPLHKVVEMVDRYEEITDLGTTVQTPFAELFKTFDGEDGPGRELTAEEAAKCRALEARLYAGQTAR